MHQRDDLGPVVQTPPSCRLFSRAGQILRQSGAKRDDLNLLRLHLVSSVGLKKGGVVAGRSAAKDEDIRLRTDIALMIPASGCNKTHISRCNPCTALCHLFGCLGAATKSLSAESSLHRDEKTSPAAAVSPLPLAGRPSGCLSIYLSYTCFISLPAIYRAVPAVRPPPPCIPLRRRAEKRWCPGPASFHRDEVDVQVQRGRDVLLRRAGGGQPGGGRRAGRRLRRRRRRVRDGAFVCTRLCLHCHKAFHRQDSTFTWRPRALQFLFHFHCRFCCPSTARRHCPSPLPVAPSPSPRSRLRYGRTASRYSRRTQSRPGAGGGGRGDGAQGGR